MTLSTANFDPRPSILVLGGEGMLGHKMFQVLSAAYPQTKCTIFGSLDDPFYKAIPLYGAGNTIESVDAMDFSNLRDLLELEKPGFIINCIGIVKQRQEAKAPIPSISLNSLLPHLLAEWAAGWGGRLIHFSTDCVFSGKKGGYSEDDPSDAEDLYGRSKSLGEVGEAANALTLRTSIIGRELSHFQALLEWLLAQKGRQIKGFKKVVYSGVTTNFMADLVARIIGEYPRLSGLFQVAAPPISKYDLLVRLREAYGLEVDIVPDDTEMSDRSMTGDRFRKATGYEEPSWDDLVKQLVEDPTPYKSFREVD
jgi:dTDP-4-dehydrorhamnose reductase